ncbi:MAG: PrpR N-terminal domain-containing protein [Bilophila wadsworthia]
MPLPQIRIVSISLIRNGKDRSGCHRGPSSARAHRQPHHHRDRGQARPLGTARLRRHHRPGLFRPAAEGAGTGRPVIDIAISGYDVIRSIQECQRRFQTRRIGFVGFYNAFNGIEQFSGMFGCDIRVYIPECAAEIRHALELAKQDGCDVIVGGYSVQQDAGLLGLPAILLRTGRETYAQSLEEAIRTVTLVQQERIRTETYKIITESVKDGLLYVDASGIIRLDNPAACLMRDAPLKDVPLETAFPA